MHLNCTTRRMVALVALISATTTITNVFASVPSLDSVLLRGTSFGNNKMKQQRGLQYSFTECSNEFSTKTQISLDEYALYIVNSATSDIIASSAFDTTQLEKSIKKGETYLPSPLVSVLRTASIEAFISVACTYYDNKNNDLKEYCKKDKSVENIPSDLTVLYEKIGNEDKIVEVIEGSVCLSIGDNWDNIVERVVAYYAFEDLVGNAEDSNNNEDTNTAEAEVTYSALNSKCQSTLKGKSKLGREKFAAYLTDIATSQDELEDYQEKVWDDDNSVQDQFQPPFYSTSVKVFRVFASHACKHDESGDEDVAAYCQNQDSADIEDLPSNTRLVFKNMDTDDVNMAVIDMCSEMETKLDKIIQNVKAFYDTIDFEAAVPVQEAEAETDKDKNTDTGEESDESFSTNQCENYFTTQVETTSHDFQEYIFTTSAKTISKDSDEVSNYVFDNNKELIHENIPHDDLSLLPKFVLVTFLDFACEYNTNSDELTEFCSLEEGDVTQMPESTTIAFADLTEEERSGVASDLCRIIDDKWNKILARTEDYFDEVLSGGNDKNGEDNNTDGLNEDGTITTVMDFGIRVEDEGFTSETALARIVRSEIKRLVQAGLSGDSRRNRRALQEAIGEIESVLVSTLDKVDCIPEAEEGASCYDGKATIIVTPTDPDMTAENIQSTVISSIQKDQVTGAYFSDLDGFKSMPEGYIPSEKSSNSNVEAQTASNSENGGNSGLGKTTVIAIVCGSIGILLICVFAALTVVKKRGGGRNAKKKEINDEIEELTAKNSPMSHTSGNFGLDSDSDDSSDSSKDSSDDSSDDDSDDESEKNDLFDANANRNYNSNTDQPNFMVDISSASNLSRNRSSNSNCSHIELVLSQDMRDELDNPAPAAEIRRRRSQPIAKKGEWVSAIDPESGDEYYYHTVTKEVTWDSPF